MPEISPEGATSQQNQPEYSIRDTARKAYQEWIYQQVHKATLEPSSLPVISARIARILEAKDNIMRTYKDKAYLDELTGLPNDKAFALKLENLAAKKAPFGLLLLDGNGIKGINDKFGHLTGDQAITHIGLSLMSALRQVREGDDENNGSDFVFRLHGDEYACLLSHISEPENLKKVADRLRIAIFSTPFVVMGDKGVEEFPVSASVGGGIFQEGNLKEFVDTVDKKALYAAKTSGDKNSSFVLGRDNTP